jgi:hypothetical protein
LSTPSADDDLGAARDHRRARQVNRPIARAVFSSASSELSIGGSAQRAGNGAQP